MKHVYHLLAFCFLLGTGTSSLFAQLPPLQPEQDCVNALPVCQNVYVQPNSYQGEGNNPNEISNVISCLGTGERNDTWYIFTTQTAGTVGFSISPVDPTDDYDWAVYNLTNNSCADIATNAALEVSCNYSGAPGVTGPNGLPGGQNEPVIPVNAGETYVINVSNFSGTTTGYTLDFSVSTATIFDNVPPTLDTVFVACGSSNINLTFSENVVCSSVDPTDFTVTGPGGPFIVNSVTGVSCMAGGSFEDNFTITTTPPITMAGLYTISLVDTVVDNCGNVAIFNSFDAFISPQGAVAAALPPTICSGQSTILSTNFSAQPGYTFVWMPGGSTSPTPQVSPNTTTTYTVVATDPTGCTANGNVTVTVNQQPTSTFNLPPQACEGESVNITYTGNASVFANYLWNFGSPDILLGSGPGPYQATWNTSGTQTISLTVIDNGCISSPTSVQIDIGRIPISSFAVPPSVCVDDVAQLTYTGNSSTNASYAWTFDGGVVLSGAGQGPYQVQWLTPGQKDVCLQLQENGCLSQLVCQTVDVTARPDIDINPVANQCLGGNSFTFTTSGGSADTYLWNFGPSANPPASSSSTPPAVTYLSPGIKTVSLVPILNGCVGDSSIITFEVVDEPTANFNASTASICTDSCIAFSYAGFFIPPTMSFFWDFGPGAIPASSTLPTPPCVEYATGGSKTVSLTVSYKGCTVSSSQSIQVAEAPLAVAGPDVEFCEGTGGIQLDGTASGGTAPYFYTWWCDDPPNCGISDVAVEDPSVNPHVNNPTEVVEYYFQITDVNGCQSEIDVVEVTVKARPEMDAGPDLDLCPPSAPGGFLQGGLAPTNSAPGPISYFWSPSEGLNNPNDNPNPYARPDSTTIYTLVGISANGCSSLVNTLDPLSTAEVRVKPRPQAFAGPDTSICVGESVTLQGFADGAGPNYQYVWTPALPGTIDDPNSPTPTVSPAATTTFTLTVISNGCESDGDQITVFVDTKPTLTAGTDESICANDSVRLDGRANGDPDASSYSYSWSPPQGLSDPNSATPLASPDTTTEYVLTVKSEFGCESATDTMLVTLEPTPTVLALDADTAICAGEELVLTALHTFPGPTGGPVIYEWSPAEFVTTDIYDSVVTVAPTRTTEFVVKTSIASNDCPTFDQVLVVVNPQVSASIEADTNRICEGEPLELRASGGQGSAKFTWIPQDGLSDPNAPVTFATPQSSTTYQVVVSEGICQDTAEFELIINPAPQTEYMATITEGCAPLDVSFLPIAPDANSFRWDFGDGTAFTNEEAPTHTFTDPGTYTVSLTTSGIGGCEASNQTTTVIVTEPPTASFIANPDAGTDIPLPGAAITFEDQSQGASSWLWDFGDGGFSSSQHPIHEYDRAGTYSVRLSITDEAGCVATTEYGPFTIINPEVVVPNIFSPNQDGINDEFQVRYTGKEAYSLIVQDRWGRTVFEAEGPASTWDGSVGNSQAPEGVYYYMLKVGTEEYSGNVTLLR